MSGKEVTSHNSNSDNNSGGEVATMYFQGKN